MDMARMTFAVSPEVKLGDPLPPIDYRRCLASSLKAKQGVTKQSFLEKFRSRVRANAMPVKEFSEQDIQILPQSASDGAEAKIEALWTPSAAMIECSENHALLTAIHRAFYDHYPLQLSPDIIWITLARGFALHIQRHAETYRHRFVSHEGKLKLVVERQDFFPGKDNPWPEAFAAFSDQIAQHVGKMREFIRCDFSTTGPTELTASELMVMETFEPYFEYELKAGCGIPSITLTGTVDDWKAIRTRARLFSEFGLEQWSRALDPVLAQFVSAVEGQPEVSFWKSLFRFHSGSGPSVMTGWVNTFFPYILDRDQKLEPNPCLSDWHRRLNIDDQQDWRERWRAPQGFGMGVVPPCLTSVPLKVVWGQRECAMRLVGGLMGVSQDPHTLTIQPECGWAVIYDSEEDRQR
jgi:hypothetical protein